MESAEKACDNYADAIQIDVDRLDGAPNAYSDDEIREKCGLILPLVSYSGWTLRMMVTAVAECMIAVLLNRGGNRNCIGEVRRRCILVRDIALAIKRDVELAAIARSWCLDLSMTAASVDEGRSAEQRLANLFPHTQIQLRELNRYAWYNHPAQVESVLTKFISGELPQGDPALAKLHIQPVAYFGRNKRPIHYGLYGGYRNDSDSDDDDDGYVDDSQMELAFDLFAFDLIDAAGVDHPLLVEFRLDSRACPFARTDGRVANRPTSKKVGKIKTAYRSCAELGLLPDGDNSGDTDEASAREGYDDLPNYTSHQVAVELVKEAFGQIKPNSREPAEGEVTVKYENEEFISHPIGYDEITNYEIESLICAAINIIGGWGSEESLPSLSRFQFMHPPAVITRFTRALYRAAFDSPQVKSTLRDDFHLPNDLLGVIGDYAPVDLPYLPLDPKMGKAPLSLSVPVPVTSRSASDAASGALTGVNSSIATTVTSTGPTVSVTPTSSTVDSPSGPTAVPVRVTTGPAVSVTSVMTQMSASALDSIPIIICLSSAAAKRSAAEAELADHKVTVKVTVTEAAAAAGTMTTSGYQSYDDHHDGGKLTNHGDAAAPIVAIPASGSDIPECDSHSADRDSDSGAPPPNKKHKSIGETPTGVTDSTSGTAAASSSSASDSAIAPSVIYPKDKWTELVPPNDLSSRFVASNGRSFNFRAMVEDSLALLRKPIRDYSDEEGEDHAS